VAANQYHRSAFDDRGVDFVEQPVRDSAIEPSGNAKRSTNRSQRATNSIDPNFTRAITLDQADVSYWHRSKQGESFLRDSLAMPSQLEYLGESFIV